MTLQEKINRLAVDLSVFLLPQDGLGVYTVDFANEFEAQFVREQGHDVVITNSFLPNIDDIKDWQWIESLLSLSYGWPGLATSLTISASGQVQIESKALANSDYVTFYKTVSRHCDFCALARLELDNNNNTQAINHHEFVLL